jgi:hypothetical protein
MANYQGKCQSDTLLVTSVKDMQNIEKKCIIRLRTYQIIYRLGFRTLDTNNNKTVSFLDSLAKFLLNQAQFPLMEIDIHLSLHEWDGTYSVSLLQNMYEEIIDFLVKRGIPRERLHGKQLYNYYPLYVGPEEVIINDEGKKEYLKSDWLINRRVEFLINLTGEP